MTEFASRCYRCMQPIVSENDVCPHCGHDNHIRTSGYGYLPACLLQNQYLVGHALGRGGFGITYIGYDLILDRVVAVKEYFPADKSVRINDSFSLSAFSDCTEVFREGCARALRESRIAARVQNIPGVVQIYNAFTANNTIYIVMEYIDGETFTKHLDQRGGRMPWPQVLALMNPVMDTLIRLHGADIVHRDVKPDNIMIRRSDGMPVLLDFGAAQTISNDTISHSTTRSLGYAPLEQYNSDGAIDGRLDQYALCATMLRALTGKRPPEATSRILNPDAHIISCTADNHLTESACAAILRGFSIQAENRFDSVAQLKAALNADGTEAKAKAKAEAEAEAKAKAEAKARAEAAARAKAEAEAKSRAEAEAKARAEAEAKARANPVDEAAARARAGTEARVRAEAAAQGIAEAKIKAQAEADAKAKAKEEAMVKIHVRKRRLRRLLGISAVIILILSYPNLARNGNLPTPSFLKPYLFYETSSNDDGSLTITNYHGSEKKVTIPESIGGKPVTAIVDAFYSDIVVEVIIPDSVTIIGRNAFEFSRSLERITIPNSVTQIGSWAFMGCNTLSQIDIPNSVSQIDAHTFHGCTSLTQITIPDSVISIDEYAFKDCDSLATVTIPNSVTQIGSAAFSGCDALTEIIIPDTITVINGGMFNDCRSLAAITIPDSVTKIDYGAFWRCSSLTHITIPDSVTEIGDRAFEYCDSLTAITIPDSVTKIDGRPFAHCPNLTLIVERGSYAEEYAKDHDLSYQYTR